MNDPRSVGRVLTVVGTRPEAIKMAPVLRALESRTPRLDSRLVLTGQHTELVDEALSIFELDPDWDLDIMREGQGLAQVGSECLEAVDRLLGEWRPDLLLVQGDTASVFFSALAGYFHGIPTGHVEAGLRTGDLRRPFPEEGFRRLAGVLADLHFAPTEAARQNLLREGIDPGRIEVTGNTVVDALLEIAERREPVRCEALRRLLAPGAPPFLLLTAHRRESFGAPLERVFEAVEDIVASHDTVEILFPVHPNPNVAGPAERRFPGHPRIHLSPPLRYPDLVAALAGAKGVLTDSGGIQEEAPTFGTPVLVLREVSERPEGIEAGVARLVGTDADTVRAAALDLLQRGDPERERVRRDNPYGDGRAGERIARRVEAFLAERDR